MNTVKIFTAQENRCNIHLDDAVTVLSNVTLSAPSYDNMVSADEVQRIAERTLLAQQKSFSASLHHGSKMISENHSEVNMVLGTPSKRTRSQKSYAMITVVKTIYVVTNNVNPRIS